MARVAVARGLVAVIAAYAAFSLASTAASAADAPGASLEQRGEYVLRAAGCAACHTEPDAEDGFLAGGRALDTPFGRFYSPNITPHPQHGIGAWSADDLWRALTLGEGPHGRRYYPVFPYPTYTRMRRGDADALHAYLMSVEPSARRNREHELRWFVRLRIVNRVWNWLFLDAERLRPDPMQSEQRNRGAYLVEALAHCGECHTPRNLLGALERARWLAGNPHGPGGEPVPNITPHEENGIGRWGPGAIAEYLATGMDPDFDFAGGAMAEVIDEGTRHLTRDDLRAIVVYLKSIAPLP